MDVRHINLFDLAEQRLAWTARRQALLAQNIANVSTPGFVPRDLPSFAKTLDQVGAHLTRTRPNHMAGAAAGSLLSDMAAQPAERTADGNGVVLDDQLTKVADTETTQTLVTSIYRKYLTLFNLALGRTQ